MMSLATVSEYYNVSVPFTEDVPQPFGNGSQIFIDGLFRQNQFAVNLQCGRQPQADIALHFNPRISENSVVRNSCEGGNWKEQEGWGGFPFQSGQQFKLVFQVEHPQYKIFVNGNHFQNFQHRIPLHRITTLCIRGDVTVNVIRHSNPAPYQHMPSYGSRQTEPTVNLPYMSDIPQPVCAGKKIIIRGHIPQNNAQFAVNLQCGKDGPPKNDVALHFNPRFTEDCIVRNSYQGGHWMEEERYGGFPFQTGQAFMLVLLVEYENYKIIVNGKLFQTFQHRIPLHRVTNILVKGNIIVNSVRYEDPPFQPQPLPYIADIPSPVCPGTKVIIRGTIPQSDATFAVNLQNGKQEPPHLDIALHFNPRLSENCVVRNSHQGGKWNSKEERWGGFPFQTGQKFELVFLVEHDQYKIMVDGKMFQTFQHRIPFNRVTTIAIKGNITIHSVRFGDPNVGNQVHPPASSKEAYQPFDSPPPYGKNSPYGMTGSSYQHYPLGQQPPPYQHLPQSGFSGTPNYSQGGTGYAQPVYHSPASSGFSGMSKYPQGGAGYAQPIYHPTVPFVTGIPGGLNPGNIICVDGLPLAKCRRFNLNLQSASSDIAFYIDVRITFNSDVNVIVRNAKFNGIWGNEERSTPHFPFVRGSPFQIMILVSEQAFKMAVNGQHLLEFRHRLGYGDHISNYNIFRIDGDVELSQIRFQ